MRTVFTCEDCVSFRPENNFCDLLCVDCSPESYVCPFFFSNSYVDRKCINDD